MTVVRCNSCYEMLGTTNEDENLVRLYKSQLSIAIESGASKFCSYPSATFICAQILSLIEATALKRFVVHSSAPDDDTFDGKASTSALILWAFNPDIYYSCSAYANNNTFDQSLEQLKSAQDRGVDEATEGQVELPIRNGPQRPPGPEQTGVQVPSSRSTEHALGSDLPVEHINLVHRAVKIFYKDMPGNTTPAQFLNDGNNASSYEELYLINPADLVALRGTLEQSTSMLPGTARTFQEWQVGLLNRYEKIPSGFGVMAENPLARGIKAKDGRVTRWDLGYGAEGLYS